MTSVALHKKNTASTSTFFVIYFLILIFAATFNASATAFKPIGYLSLLVALTSSVCLGFFHYFTYGKISKTQMSFFLIATSYVLLTFLGLLNHASSRSFIVIFQFITVFSFFQFASLIKWDVRGIKIGKNLSALFILFILATWVASGFSKNFPSIYANPNVLGPFITFAMFFVLLQKKRSLVNISLVSLSLILIYFSGARSVLLLIAAASITYFLWNFISKSKFRYITFFLLLVSAILMFVYVYPNLIYHPEFHKLNYLMWQYTGKNLMSGREDIWLVLTELINQRPLLGYGTGVLPADLLGITLSSHNLYLQISLQNGYLGLACILLLFFTIWLSFRKSRNEYATRLSASFFVGILVFQSFEVSLTQNQLSIGLMLWFIISIGVSHSLSIAKKQLN